MKLRYLLAALFLAIAAAGCFKENRWPGYSITESGLHYKLHKFGDGSRKPAEGEFLVLRMAFRTEKDSVFIDTYSSSHDGRITVPFTKAPFMGSFEEGIAMLSEGDSATFIVSADSLFRKVFKVPMPFFVSEGGMVKVDVKLEKILSSKEYEKKLDEQNSVAEDRDLEEHKLLNSYLEQHHFSLSPLDNGIFYVPLEEGTGSMAERGKTVVVSWKGYFLNGKMFESTIAGSPFEFTLGQQGQVLKGLELGICLMKEGGKAKFILPSHLAYGAAGSSTGIVPPYTSVVYEVELHKVK
jgi:FKBP-type peptidyl-prolyl cis-trans isomerase FkpA